MQTMGKLFHSNYHLPVQQNMLSNNVAQSDSCKPHDDQLQIWN